MKKLKVILTSILLLSISASDFSFSQEKHFLEPYVIPFIYRLGDINKQFIHVESEFVDVNYANHPSYEFGIQYRYNYKPRLSFLIGVSQMRSKYELSSFSMYRPRRIDGELLPSSTMFTISSSLDIKYLGGKVGFKYQINDRIKVGFAFNYYLLNIPHFFERNPDPINRKIGMTGSNNVDDHSFEFHTEIRSPLVPRVGLALPEIDMEFEILKNLTFNVGVRSRFWENNYNGYFFEIKVHGSPDRANISEDLLHHSSASTHSGQSFYIFTGIKYAIPMSLFKKVVSK